MKNLADSRRLPLVLVLFVFCAAMFTQNAGAMIMKVDQSAEVNMRFMVLKIKQDQYVNSVKPKADPHEREREIVAAMEAGMRAALAEERAEPLQAMPLPPPAIVLPPKPLEATDYYFIGGFAAAGVIAMFFCWAVARSRKQKKTEMIRLAALCQNQEVRLIAKAKHMEKLFGKSAAQTTLRAK